MHLRGNVEIIKVSSYNSTSKISLFSDVPEDVIREERQMESVQEGMRGTNGRAERGVQWNETSHQSREKRSVKCRLFTFANDTLRKQQNLPLYIFRYTGDILHMRLGIFNEFDWLIANIKPPLI